MTDDQISNMIKKHNDLMDFMTEDEREKYYESYGLPKKDCAVCEAKDICVYATEVVPKTQKAYFCKDALERYQKVQDSKNNEKIDLSGVKYDCSTCKIKGACTNMTSDIPYSHQNWWCENDRRLYEEKYGTKVEPELKVKEKQYDTTTEITNFNVNWKNIKSACMTTIRKQAGDKEPNKEWKRKLLICQHSPIRRGIISWKWDQIPYAISTHFARHHEGCEKFIGTSRTDRTNVDRENRSQMSYVPMEMDANIQALINIAERRLCMCADKVTRKYMEALVEEIRKYDEDIAWALVPQCVRCGGCVEPFSNCKYYDNLYKDIPYEEKDTVMKRYDIFDKQRVRSKTNNKNNTH